MRWLSLLEADVCGWYVVRGKRVAKPATGKLTVSKDRVEHCLDARTSPYRSRSRMALEMSYDFHVKSIPVFGCFHHWFVFCPT